MPIAEQRPASNLRPQGRRETGRAAVVVVGRNEGRRLRRCLEAAVRCAERVIYVDSASSDGSPAVARELGVELVELDPALPTTAARARNAGFQRVLECDPQVDTVQFIDGDCEIAEGWLDMALDTLRRDDSLAMVTGRIEERHAQATVYHLLCHLEWQQPVGEVAACGGLFAIRARVFQQAGWFNAAVVAAEDDEFCLRVRRAGGRIERLDRLMATHDVGAMSLWRWWLRMTRAGLAYGQGFAMHGRSPERHFAKQVFSTAFWGGLLPLSVAAAAWPTGGLALSLLLLYPLLGWRIYRFGRRQGWRPSHARAYALFTVLAKFPQMAGLIRYLASRLRGQGPRILEHNKSNG